MVRRGRQARIHSYRFFLLRFKGAWMLVWLVTQALAGAIDRGDPMGVQRVLGKPGMERG